MLSNFVNSWELGDFPKNELNGILQGIAVVLESWPSLSARYIGIPVEGPALLPFEFSVKFSGNFSGYLNIRTSKEMSDILSRLIDNPTHSRISNGEIFKEFVDVFCGRLMAYLWRNNWGLFKTQTPVISTPEDWPKNEPVTGCTFLVENWPMEVRLWIVDRHP